MDKTPEPAEDQRPHVWSHLITPSGHDLRALAIPLIAALALAVVWWWTGRPSESMEIVSPVEVSEGSTRAVSAPLGDVTPTPQEAATSGDPAGLSLAADPLKTNDVQPQVNTSGAPITVDVRGNVLHRGVQQLPPGSRVTDAISAAGGLRKGRSFGDVNLAEKLADGQQIVVGRTAQGPALASTQGKASGAVTPADPAANSTPVNLNTALAPELQTLPGVGPVLAQRIIDRRDSNGPYQSVDGLMDVSGIGVKVLEGLRSRVNAG